MVDKVTTTKRVRFHIDLELHNEASAEELYILRAVVERTLTTRGQVITPPFWVAQARVTQIIPKEADFDWQGQ